ncbi:MAG: enoyl-CoA hydratase/isomerase family protein [Actinobacteria bacterium]|nr:enoyl-CoA hydratase/isomerase family protein [Actinomycetota bacterium]
MSLKVNKAAVVGAGTMGGEIAFVIASAGIPVLMKDVDQKFVDHGIETAEKLLAKLVAKEKLTREAADATRALITGTLDYSGFGDVDFVVEAVPERMQLKQAVFAELDAATPGHAILASNTSALSIDEIGAATTRPDKVVGFHFFYPASVAKLIEVIEGEATSPETTLSAYNFAQAIKKAPITCADAPGFVVNRLLCASMGEMHRVADEHDLSPAQMDAAITGLKVAPTGPCALSDMLGLDTVLHVLEHLNEQLGDDFYVPPKMKSLVEDGDLGLKTGKGFFDPPGQAPAEGVDPVDPALAGEIVLRSGLRMLVEACAIVEEAIGNAREVDLGMMAGAAVIPGPLARADEMGLDNVLAALEHGKTQWGEAYEPPVLLRRLVAQGRTGKAAGQGFFAYPRPDDGEQPETVQLETRGPVAIAWLAQKPVNPISPALVRDLRAVHQRVEADDSIRALVIASSTNLIWSAGADLKAFATMTPEEMAQHVDNTLALMRGFERGDTVVIACVNGAALGGGCELAMSADIRIAGESASFGQPEISLGILPGFGGTQRLPRLVGKGAAFEMIAAGDAIDAWRAAELGLVNQVVPDHELFDTAIAQAERLAAQAPLAIAHIKRALDDPSLDAGIAVEREAFVTAMASEDAHEGVAAFLQKRAPKFNGR